ncbi:AAA family ATPase [Anaeropeptidivorans aminofermentans]|jgi:MoxR-like ATPase|uniref:AAA family ATPase n=1 Tax=Anaeropeptidivorans aminofermentans TaxID=2934315 RepID=UPI002024F83F|nr:AAA family ATPase [Anaeropeptidivorans aminofermentans]MBE6011792.1 AAA family ATPase [Lachnospiraceae bacterium]
MDKDKGLNLEGFSKDFELIEEKIGESIIGQKDTVRNVLSAIIAGGNVLLEGLPGLGKTRLVKTIGDIFNMEFSRIQFTPDLMPADITGTDILVKTSGDEGSFKFQKGPVFANIILADEINRATPKTQSALLEAMQEKTVTVGGKTYHLPEPFFVLATQNPIETEGTYPLPEAQLDRFMIKLNVDFPSKKDVLEILDITAVKEEKEKTEKLFGSEKIIQMREAAKSVAISEPVMDYAAEIVMRSHPDYENAPDSVKNYVHYGSSPRGAQAIINISRVYALIDGRFNLSYDDIKKAAFPVLRHRIYLNFEAVSQGIDTDRIIKELIKEEK